MGFLPVRRIEAVTGPRAVEVFQEQNRLLDHLAALVKSDRGHLESRLQKLLDHQKELEREIASLQGRLNAGQAAALLAEARDVGGVKLLAARLDGLDGKGLRELADQLRERLGSGVVVLGSAFEDKANLLVAVSKDLTSTLQAGALVRPLAEQVGGKGGGRPDLAQAGGPRPEGLDKAIALAAELIGEARR